MISYPVHFTSQTLKDLESWSPTNRFPQLLVNHFRPESSPHRPETHFRLAYDSTAVYGLFEVDDCFVRCVHTVFQSPTHLDSCVELFLQPDPGEGYFNFEWNCCGTLAVFYIQDPTRTAEGFKKYTRFSREDASHIRTCTTLKGVIDPEITAPTSWRLSFAIDLAVLRLYTHIPLELSGQRWRANVYKCADETSHPHWAAWSPVPVLNFHLPESFGEFQFL